jgi:potassium channel subfamily K, other eukaryote
MRTRKRLHQQLEETARTKRARHMGTLQFTPTAGAGISITGINGVAVNPDPLDSKTQAEREEAAYTKFREEMAQEEKKEFRAKLWISWGLFMAFWLIGSAIFMATEKWSYGTAVYFCKFPWGFCIFELRTCLGFMAFSTIGYGDVSPLTGTGRAVFVFWAIASVASMTVLISVIAEAYQTRYSTIVHNGLLDKQIRGLKETISLSRRTTNTEDERSQHHHLARDPDELTINERLEAREYLHQELAGLPELITQDARDFYVHIRYFGKPNPGHGDQLPPGLERVLQETMDQENMNEAMRKEVLQDEAAKKALMMLHLENTVRRLVDKAERLTVLLAERDALEGERGEEEVTEFIKEEARTLVEIGVEEGEMGTGDEEMGNQWVMGESRLHARPQTPPSRSVSRSS